jgi:hypothetical protein
MRSRVELRPPTADGRDEFIAAMLASRRLHHPWLQPPITAERYAAYVEPIRAGDVADWAPSRGVVENRRAVHQPVAVVCR